MKFCYCPPGSFMMGSSVNESGHYQDEKQVSVRISKGFWMARTECTQAQWTALMNSNPSEFRGVTLPVENVSWDEVQNFLAELNQSVTAAPRWKFVLPSEAQWEYACRAGTQTPFSFGEALNGNEANCNGNYNPYGTETKGPNLEKTAVAGSYRPNGWGLYDMHGNVQERCSDWFTEKLPGGVDPIGAAGSYLRAARGGGWNNSASNCRAACRDRTTDYYRGSDLGFRVALIPSP